MSPQPTVHPPVAVAFCPHPPSLLPGLEGAADAATVASRSACDEAVATVLSCDPDVVLVVGEGPPGVRYGTGDAADLRPWGIEGRLPFSGGVRPRGRSVPLAHAVGACLLDRAGHTGTRLGVAPGDLVDALGDLPGPVAVLAMGHGAGERGEVAPAYREPAAERYDTALAAALAAGDPVALAALDPEEGARLDATGTTTWRAVGRVLTGHPVTARLLHDGVSGHPGHPVADWVVARVPDRVPVWMSR